MSTTKANTTSILGVIFVAVLIDVGLRVPNCIKKRRIGRETDAYNTGTVTGRYLSF